MDVSTAYAVLGLKPDSSLDEAKKVFDARANRLQPERVKASLQPAAKSAMAEANEAWDVARRHLASGGGPVTYDQSSPQEPVGADPF
jgi:DnaJ-class molecular chaperone